MATSTTATTKVSQQENSLSAAKQFSEDFASCSKTEKILKLRGNLEHWKQQKLNIAVTGSSGQGKSTFINTLRRVQPGEHGAAKVGVTETTRNILQYADPKNGNLVYWDLPGCGTRNFPRESYLQTVEFHQYDFFLIVTAQRFTENDLWLAKQVIQQGKKFYLIRSKIDQDIINEQEDYPNRSENDILRRIREECAENLDELRQQQSAQDLIFLISGKYKNYYKWDFPKLVERLLQDCPTLIQEALILSIHANSKAVIEKKFEILQQRIWKVASISAGVAAVPIPGLSLAFDTGIILNEVREYKTQFDLDHDSLNKLADLRGISRAALEAELSVKDYGPLLLKRLSAYVVGILALYSSAELVEETVRVFIPLLGSLIAAGLSFGTVYAALKSILNTAKVAALDLLDYKMR